MATTFSCFRAALILSCATPRPGPAHHKPSASASSSLSSVSLGSNWWTQIFGWSSDPDYIDGSSKTHMGQETLAQPSDQDMSGRVGPKPRSKFGLGCFTEEKAKELRKRTAETSFHDIMYHSAIASRLASDLSPHDGR